MAYLYEKERKVKYVLELSEKELDLIYQGLEKLRTFIRRKNEGEDDINSAQISDLITDLINGEHRINESNI